MESEAYFRYIDILTEYICYVMLYIYIYNIYVMLFKTMVPVSSVNSSEIKDIFLKTILCIINYFIVVHKIYKSRCKDCS